MRSGLSAPDEQRPNHNPNPDDNLHPNPQPSLGRCSSGALSPVPDVDADGHGV